MKKIISIGVLCLLAISLAWAQPQKLETSLDSVTVYLSGAQLSRFAETTVPAGTSEWEVEELSPTLDLSSIQVKSSAAIVLLSVEGERSYEGDRVRDARKQAAQDSIERLEMRLAAIELEMEKLSAREGFLRRNAQIRNRGANQQELADSYRFYEQANAEIERKKLTLNRESEQIGQRISKLHAVGSEPESTEPTGTRVRLKIRSEREQRIALRLDYYVPEAIWKPQYNLRVRSAEAPVELDYLATISQNTGEHWDKVYLTLTNYNPSESGQRPKLLPWYVGYTADRFQRQVRVGGLAAEDRYYREERGDARFEQELEQTNGQGTGVLIKGKVVDAKDGEPLPGLMILIEGTDKKIETDSDGRYAFRVSDPARTTLTFSYIGFKTQRMAAMGAMNRAIQMEYDVTELQEVVVTAVGVTRERKAMGYGVSTINMNDDVGGYAGGSSSRRASVQEEMPPPLTTVSAAPQRFKITIETPYTVQSEGEPFKVPLKQYQIPATYEHFAIPYAQPEAYWVANLTDFQDLQLVRGQASLFVEGTYQGNTLFDPKASVDTLRVSLGCDPGVVVRRVPMKGMTGDRRLVRQTEYLRHWRLEVYNQKEVPINLTVYDQIPISQVEDVEVSALNLGGAELEERTGFLTWEQSYQPWAHQTMDFGYKITAPREFNLVVE